MTDDRTFTVADDTDRVNRLRVDLDAPLPLGHHAALRRAMQLLDANPTLSYTAIALIFGEYHGIHRGSGWWARELRAVGAKPRPRGLMWCGKERIPA